jgi:hypothetical protein
MVGEITWYVNKVNRADGREIIDLKVVSAGRIGEKSVQVPYSQVPVARYVYMLLS